MAEDQPTTPSDVSDERTWLDRLADAIANLISRPLFFLSCVALTLVWAGFGPVTAYSHGWIDLLQTVVALLTLAMVVLVQNEGWRANKATQRKLNAIASALAEVMENAEVDEENVRQLNSAVGLEKRESSSR